MAKASAHVKSKVVKRPVKAGAKMPRNIGGILNAKVVIAAKKTNHG
jgi:hypothetical protein